MELNALNSRSAIRTQDLDGDENERLLTNYAASNREMTNKNKAQPYFSLPTIACQLWGIFLQAFGSKLVGNGRDFAANLAFVCKQAHLRP